MGEAGAGPEGMAGRVRSIDHFRAIAIMGMVFFTLTNIYSDVPALLRHNVPGAFHIGDLVLPFFLFASGMSLWFFRKKRQGRGGYALDIAERLGRIVLIWIFLSPFSSGRFLGMDELMLNAILSPIILLMAGLSARAIFLVCALTLPLYLIMPLGGFPLDPQEHYLGGYPAAILYLPVMGSGLVCGRMIDQGRGLGGILMVCAISAAALALFIAPDKMHASPSFMALSSFAAVASFMAVDRLAKNADMWFYDILEGIGKAPIRYWALMFLFYIPALVRTAIAGKPFGEDWPVGILAALLSMGGIALLSRAMDIAPHLIRGGSGRG